MDGWGNEEWRRGEGRSWMERAKHLLCCLWAGGQARHILVRVEHVEALAQRSGTEAGSALSLCEGGGVVHAPTSSTGKANVRQLNAARTLPGCPPRCGPCFSGVRRQCFSKNAVRPWVVR